MLSLGRNRRNFCVVRKKLKTLVIRGSKKGWKSHGSFGNLMEDDADSDEEVEGLRAGLVAVKFSKVYGRSVGLNFLQNRLLSMWRPDGR